MDPRPRVSAWARGGVLVLAYAVRLTPMVSENRSGWSPSLGVVECGFVWLKISSCVVAQDVGGRMVVPMCRRPKGKRTT